MNFETALIVFKDGSIVEEECLGTQVGTGTIQIIRTDSVKFIYPLEDIVSIRVTPPPEVKAAMDKQIEEAMANAEEA